MPMSGQSHLAEHDFDHVADPMLVGLPVQRIPGAEKLNNAIHLLGVKNDVLLFLGAELDRCYLCEWDIGIAMMSSPR